MVAEDWTAEAGNGFKGNAFKLESDDFIDGDCFWAPWLINGLDVALVEADVGGVVVVGTGLTGTTVFADAGTGTGIGSLVT